MHLNQDSTYDMLATLFTSFLSIKLVRLADRTEERVLPVPVSFILDEFPNSVTRSTPKMVGITDKSVA